MRYIVNFEGQGFFGLDTAGDAYLCPEPVAHVFTTLEEAQSFAKGIGTIIPVHVTRGKFAEHIRYVIARQIGSERRYLSSKGMWLRDIGRAIQYRELGSAHEKIVAVGDVYRPFIVFLKVLEGIV